MTGMYGNAHENMRLAREQNIRVNNQTGEPVTPNPNPEQDASQVPKVDEPTVVMPDGTTVKAAEYNPYQSQWAELEKEKAFVEGAKSAVANQMMNTEVGDPNGDPQQPKQEDDPFANLPTVEITDDEYTSENEKSLARTVNALTAAFKESMKTTAESYKQLTEDVGTIGQMFSDRAVSEDLARIEAQTGVTEAEIVAASEQTGIKNVNTLARLVLGAKAEQQAIEEAQADANNQRVDSAGGIGGTTHGGGGNPASDPNDFYKRPDIDYGNNEEILKHYRLVNSGPPRISLA